MNDRILPQMTGANQMNSVARQAGLYMAPDILLEAEHIPDTQHPACLSHGPVMHILIARTEVTRIPTTLEFATSAKIQHGLDTTLENGRKRQKRKRGF